MELPLTSEGKIDFQAIFSPIPPTRDSFETKEQFAKRLQEFGAKQLQLIEMLNQAALRYDSRVQAGTVQLFKDKYNADTQEFEVNLQPAAWVEKLSLPLISVAKITIAPNEAKALFHEGQIKPLFLIIKQQGEVKTASGFLVGLEKRFELKPVENAQPKVGETFRDKLKDGSLGPEMVQLPAGKFQMGSNDGDSDEKPVHTVSVKSFGLGRYEVAFEEYDKFCEATGRDKPKGKGWGRGRRPVINVSWDDAKAYVKWLSEQTGKDYRLPTEAQWEYACRAGSVGKYSFGDDVNQLGNYGWYDENSGNKTHPVGEKQVNAFGLYDMHGNMWEWLEDVWHENYTGAPSDGSAWISGDNNSHLLRGGSWYSKSDSLRCAERAGDDSTLRYNNWGFRLSRITR